MGLYITLVTSFGPQIVNIWATFIILMDLLDFIKVKVCPMMRSKSSGLSHPLCEEFFNEGY